MSLNSGETLQPFKALNQLIFDSSGNLIGIQNDRAVGNDLRIGGGSGVDGTFATLIATTALKLNSGAVFELYNTADQTTNYERLRADWSSNVAQILSQKAGTGTSRALQIGVSTSGAATTYAADTGSLIGIANVFTAANSSGTQTAVSISPTLNQSGTAGYTAFDINPTETTTGSGTKLLQRWAVGGVAVATLTNAGNAYFQNASVVTGGSIGFAALNGVQDTSIFRDAADTLALRRSTNAQTFHVYNTYTDGSNYERGRLEWNTNTFRIGTGGQAAGTGTARSVQIDSGSNVFIAAGGTTAQWFFSTAGLLANADNTYDIGASGANRPRNLYVGTDATIGGVVVASGFVRGATLRITDGVAAPATVAGFAQIYVDTADGDLKIIFGDGTIKTIVTDT